MTKPDKVEPTARAAAAGSSDSPTADEVRVKDVLDVLELKEHAKNFDVEFAEKVMSTLQQSIEIAEVTQGIHINQDTMKAYLEDFERSQAVRAYGGSIQ